MRTSRYSWVLTMRCMYIVEWADVKPAAATLSGAGVPPRGDERLGQ